MFMILLTFFVVAFTTYMWVTRGFMSAFIHMICVIAAGAVAFGVWEPVSMFMLSRAPDGGFGSGLGGLAWGFGLALPFALTLTILRMGIDALLPANAQCDSITDAIGGGICGFIAGVISMGIIVLSIGFLRAGPSVMGYEPLQYTTQASRGSLERSNAKFIPWVDRLTVSLYSQLSLTTLRTNRPMGLYHPDFDTFPASLRFTYDGSSRNTIKPRDFAITSWYTVGDPQRPASLDPLLVDHWYPENRQRISDLHGQPITQGYLTGLVVQFRAGAREQVGNIVVGNGQVRLVVKREGEDAARAIHPIAVITRTNDPTQVAYARFRFDSDEFFVSSIGGEADALMGFEFPVPAGYRPISLYVKGVRYNLADAPPPAQNFPTVQARDQVIRDGKFEGMKEPGRIRDQDGNFITAAENPTDIWRPDPVRVSNTLGFVIQKGQERRLSVAQIGRGWVIESGTETYSKREISNNFGVDFNLQINRFGVTEDTAMIQVDVTPSERSLQFSNAYDAADRSAPLQLIDTNGRPYPAVGYIFQDSTNHRVRYTRGQPIRNLTEMPSVSRNNPDRKMTILFVVSRGVEIAEFRIGNAQIEAYAPALKTDLAQQR